MNGTLHTVHTPVHFYFNRSWWPPGQAPGPDQSQQAHGASVSNVSTFGSLQLTSRASRVHHKQGGRHAHLVNCCFLFVY